MFHRNYLLNSREIVMHNLSFPVRAKMIRIYPKRAIAEVCMRLEIYGCQGKRKTWKFFTETLVIFLCSFSKTPFKLHLVGEARSETSLTD